MKKIAILGFLAILFFAGCEKKEDDVFAKKSVEKTKFVLTALDGKEIEVTKHQSGLNFKGYEGKIVFLDFYATWCPPCKASVPHLIALQKKYKNDFEIIGVTMEQNKANSDLEEFVKSYGINYTITNSPENFELGKALGAKGLPFMIMYDKKGNYFTHYVGAVPEEMLDRDIKRILEVK